MPLEKYADLEIQGHNVHHKVGISQGELISELSKGGFGLVWYQDEEQHRGMECDISFEMAKYLAAGIPIIVPVGVSNQTLIEKNHLGLIVNSLDEGIEMIVTMRESEYQRYIQSINQFVPPLRNGYYTKKCLVDVVLSVCRNDAGEISAPANIYNFGNSAFTFSVLKESYGNNLALSWSYQGKTDGFLVYDIRENLIYDTENVHQHFCLISGYERESGFIVKAFINTLRGKLIVAESSPTYVSAEEYDWVGVSIIIPVYNAENYIARIIDLVLAQSFHDLEIIIVNDGSTDRTADIIEWYAEKYLNVKTLHQENGGPAVARNAGIKAARGEYIGFIDRDYIINP